MGRDMMEPGSTVSAISAEDEAALVAAAAVDGEAFATLYRRYRLPIYRYLRVRTTSDEDAADLVQQVFAKAFRALPEYEERGLPFRAWLFRLAQNTAIDASRHNHQTVPLDDLSMAHEPHLPNEPEASALRADALTRFQQLIAPLDAERRDLLTLRFVHELPTAEIARILGKQDAAVRAQLKRALTTLKERQHDR